MRTPAIALAVAVVVMGGGNAVAHRLKLFAAVAGHSVSGYGFFVGGGRAAGTALVARTPGGRDIWRGTTGEDGTFAFDVAEPGTLTLVLDAGDGHATETTLVVEAADAAVVPSSPATPMAPPQVPPLASAVAPDEATLAPLIAAAIDRAVAREIRPLLEASAAAEARIRLNDVLGGLGWIAGLVGTALFFLSRRRL